MKSLEGIFSCSPQPCVFGTRSVTLSLASLLLFSFWSILMSMFTVFTVTTPP